MNIHAQHLAERIKLTIEPKANDDEALRILWLNVLFRLCNDAIGNIPSGSPIEREKCKENARAYFNDRNSDFRVVCLLAGVEPDRTLAFVQKTIADADTTVALFAVRGAPTGHA